MDERLFGVLLDVAYRGTTFSGFAIQKEARTVEGELRGAILAIDPRASTTRAVSRTDAGDHAEDQEVAFDARLPVPPRGWVLALNKHLPDTLAVRAARSVSPGYNPRFSSLWKRYRYHLLLDKVRDPAFADRSWRVGWTCRSRPCAPSARPCSGPTTSPRSGARATSARSPSAT